MPLPDYGATYLYFRHHAEDNPIVSKWYMEKEAHPADTGPSPGCKPRPKFPLRSKGPAPDKPDHRLVHYMNEVQPDSDSEDSSEEDTI